MVLLWTLGFMYLLKLCFPPDICPGAGLLDHMVVLFFFFFFLKETPLLFSLVIVPIYILTNSVGRFQLVIVFKPPFCSKEKFEESNKNPLEEVWFELVCQLREKESHQRNNFTSQVDWVRRRTLKRMYKRYIYIFFLICSEFCHTQKIFEIKFQKEKLSKAGVLGQEI